MVVQLLLFVVVTVMEGSRTFFFFSFFSFFLFILLLAVGHAVVRKLESLSPETSATGLSSLVVLLIISGTLPEQLLTCLCGSCVQYCALH